MNACSGNEKCYKIFLYDEKNFSVFPQINSNLNYNSTTITVLEKNRDSTKKIKKEKEKRNLKEERNLTEHLNRNKKILKRRHPVPGVNGPNILFIMADDLGELEKKKKKCTLQIVPLTLRHALNLSPSLYHPILSITPTSLPLHPLSLSLAHSISFNTHTVSLSLSLSLRSFSLTSSLLILTPTITLTLILHPYLNILGYGDLSVFPFLTPNSNPSDPCSEGSILTPNLELMAKRGKLSGESE